MLTLKALLRPEVRALPTVDISLSAHHAPPYFFCHQTPMDHRQSIVIAPIEAALLPISDIAHINTALGSPQIRTRNNSTGIPAMIRRICFEGKDVG